MKPRGLRKGRVGVVVSDKMHKSIIVEVERRVTHAVFGKIQRRRSRFVAHDEANACRVGDRVRIVETRPLSKTKRWRVQEKLS